MDIYQTRFSKLPGTSYSEIYKAAFKNFKAIKSTTKRRPYVRSKFFKNEKVFLELFWIHIHDKTYREREIRLKYFLPAIDLIKNTKCVPTIKQNPDNRAELLYRFYGKTPQSELFHVQIKENIKKKQKWFMSVFPER